MGRSVPEFLRVAVDVGVGTEIEGDGDRRQINRISLSGKAIRGKTKSTARLSILLHFIHSARTAR
jgi:hypothetical protein